MTARMPCRSSSSNAANTLAKVNIRIQFLLVYGNCNRMSLISGNEIDVVFFWEAKFSRAYRSPNIGAGRSLINYSSWPGRAGRVASTILV